MTETTSSRAVAVSGHHDAIQPYATPQYGVESTLAVSLARAEIDQQIATARALPRMISRVVQNIQTLATLDAESAEECIYALPRGGKPIKGPSVRLAEIIAGQWGNCRIGTRVVHVDRIEKIVEAEGVFHDLETNVAHTARVRRRISDRGGKLLTDDMIVVTGNAAAAIAKRNAILSGVPKGVWRGAYAAVERVIAGDVKTLVERRDTAMKAFAAFGVKPELVFLAIGVSGKDDITIEHMGTLLGMHSALKSGEATVEELFPAKAVHAGERAKSLGDRLDALASQPPKQPAHDPETGEILENDVANRQAEAPVTSQPPVAEQPATNTAAGGDDFPGDTVRDWGSEESVKIAHAEGREACVNGDGRSAMNADYSKDGAERERKAWTDGWREADAEANQSGGE